MRLEKAIRAALIALPVSCAHAQLTMAEPVNRITCMSQPEPSSISDELEKLAVTVLQKESNEVKTPIPQQVLDGWLQGCSFDDAKKKLEQAGFQVGEYHDISDLEVRRSIRRVADGEKTVRLYRDERGAPLGAFLARVMLWDTSDRGFHADGFFYSDGP